MNALDKSLRALLSFEKLTDVYTRAFELGLKGCTIFRPNPVTGNVLEKEDKEKVETNQCCQHE